MNELTNKTDAEVAEMCFANHRYKNIIVSLTREIEEAEKELAYALDFQSKSTYYKKLRVLRELVEARDRFIFFYNFE